MNQPSSPEPNQRTNIDDSSISGQVGQAGRDSTQHQGTGNIFKDVTIYFNPQKKDSDNRQTRQEDLNRQALLNKVHNYWIKGVMERSLYSRIKIELGLEERLDAIDLVSETPEHLRQFLPPGMKAIAKFDELGVGRTLLILGQPGSGKTITMLEIASELIERAKQDPQAPIPVVFNFSSWVQERCKMVDWLVKEFETGIYKIPKVISQNWIENQQLLLLLDGLDEVREELRESCVQAINQFSQDYGRTEIIVSSRIKAYENVSQYLRLRFQNAILLQPLTSEQIENYLNQATEELHGVQIAMQTDPVLQKLAQTPLMLSIMALAYQDVPASEFSAMNLETRQQHLWDKYIDRIFERKHRDRPYSRNLTLHWLKFLAQRTIQESQTQFLIEQIKPSWLKPGMQRRIYPLAAGLIAGLIVEWVYGFPLGLIAGQLSFQMLIGLTIGVLGVIASLNFEIQLFTAIRRSWSFRKAWKAAFAGLISSLLIGVIIWLIGTPLGLVASSLQYFLLMGLNTGLAIAVISAILVGLVDSKKLDDETNANLNNFTDTNQGVWQSASISGLITLVTFTVIILPQAILNEFFTPLSALLGCVSLYAGGMACIQHLTIRLMLWRNRQIPWNYTHFLNYATEQMFIQKTGGGYQFIHDLLRRRIALNQDFKTTIFSKNIKITRLNNALITISIIAALLLSFLLPLTINTWRVPPSLAERWSPRLNTGDRLIIDRVRFHFGELQRWDIISFKPTTDMREAGFKYTRAVKQVLGIPGEKIKIKDGNIYINDKILNNSNYLAYPDFLEYLKNHGSSITVPKNMYLVTVNITNDKNKNDKFNIHLIPKKQIDGLVTFRFWPVNKIGAVAQ
ncbi:signal peptidase I [Nostoc sp. DedQUE09]|uniref:signal peptidase I n=1 Tax=Nostoc sp. DedQUE09 TaxID=3075394 RepID=UPI002AD52FDF|nr:signal peptidase I [Nostoc sp. DedQUE09]MDZ7955382.1 signal peptidase I [Nostoc sp. DedQUE09]